MPILRCPTAATVAGLATPTAVDIARVINVLLSQAVTVGETRFHNVVQERSVRELNHRSF